MKKIQKRGAVQWDTMVKVALALFFGLIALVILFYYIFPSGWIDKVLSSIFG